MTRMGGRRRLRSFAAPSFWPIPRKERFWTVKPSPGPHPIERALPLLILIRDVLGYAKTAREARKVLAEGAVKVDGRVRRDYKFPVGFMDVIEIVPTGEKYRFLPYPVKFFTLHPITDEEAGYKLVRIENKTTVKGGHIQLNFHDGRNHIVRIADPQSPVEDVYSTLGTVKLSIPEQEILDYVPLEEGNLAMIIGGKNVGRVGVIKEVKRGMRRYRSIVTLETADGSTIQTSLNYVFVVGRKEPMISLPEGVWR